MKNQPADPQIGATNAPKGKPAPAYSSPSPMAPAASSKADQVLHAAAEAKKSVTGRASAASQAASKAASQAADTVKTKAADIADRAAGIADNAAGAARSRAESFTDQVNQKAENAVDGVLAQVHERVDSTKGQASNYVASFGRALQAASQSLEDDGMTLPAGYVRAAANGLNQAANEVDGFDTGAVTSNVEYYVRGNPMLAVAGMTLVGFALTRLIGSGRRR